MTAESAAELLRVWTRAALASSRSVLESRLHGTGREADTMHAVAASAVRHYVHEVLARVASECNRHGPLVALPIELLRRIFRFVGTDDRWALSQTCSHLRACCLATPALWRTILPQALRLSSNQSAPLTAGFINTALLLAVRSIPEVLDFRAPYLIDGPDDERVAVALLLPLLPRLRFLALSPVWQGQWGQLLELLESPAPALEELRIYDVNMGRFPLPAVLPTQLFAGAPAGRLRALELHDVLPPALHQPCAAFWNLRMFTWRGEYRWDLVVDSEDFCHILRLMPRLETLRLSVCDFLWSDTDVSIPESCRLRSFELHYARTLTNGVRCLRALTTLSNFTCGIARRGQPAQFLQEISTYPLQAYGGPVASVIIVQPENFSQPIFVWGEVENLFELENTPIIGHASATTFSPFAARSLTRLSLHEFYWPEEEPLPAFPQLHWLRILLASCSSHRLASARGHVAGRCILEERSLPPWNAPVLETLRIAHVGSPQTCRQKGLLHGLDPGGWLCYCSKPLSVSLADVHRLVTTSVLRSGQRLSRIELQGVEAIDHDPWGPIALLDALADEFTTSSLCESMTCDLDTFSLPMVGEGDNGAGEL